MARHRIGDLTEALVRPGITVRCVVLPDMKAWEIQGLLPGLTLFELPSLKHTYKVRGGISSMVHPVTSIMIKGILLEGIDNKSMSIMIGNYSMGEPFFPFSAFNFVSP